MIPTVQGVCSINEKSSSSSMWATASLPPQATQQLTRRSRRLESRLKVAIKVPYTAASASTLSPSPNRTIKLLQPRMIDQIMQEMNLAQRATMYLPPAKPSVILRGDFSAPTFDHQFLYRYVVRNINFLKKSTQSNISYVTHQVARFYKEPCCTHGADIEHLSRYLLRTRGDRLILYPNHAKSFKVYADSDLCGNW